MKRLLVTGGCGFIGSNFIRHVLSRFDTYRIVNLDLLSYAGNPDNLSDLERDDRYIFVKGNINDYELVSDCIKEYGCSVILNFAAETHVDRSIMQATDFIDTNVKGTQVLLDAVKNIPVEKFIQISTDEVYGEVKPPDKFTENSPLRPNSPYAASKSAADHLVQAYRHTFDIPAIITRSTNNFGPFQYPEKLIPLMIINSLRDKSLPVYGDGTNVREWIYVEDHCKALIKILERGETGEDYNISSGNEMTNIDMVRKILKKLEKPDSLIKFVADRPGHDRRYAVDSGKLRLRLGWEPETSFEEALDITIKWYIENEQWWKKIISGAYKDYYYNLYGELA